MSEEIIIGKRFTMVLPKRVRVQLKLKEGQHMQVRIENGRIVLDPFPLNPYAILQEIIKEPYNEEVDEVKAEKWLKEHAGR